MSAIIMMRIFVKKGCIEKFIKKISWKHIVITDIHDWVEGYEFFTMPEQIGYYEPVELYKEIENLVTDIWYNCIGDIDLISGKDEKQYNWESCKKIVEKEEDKLELLNEKTKKELEKRMKEVEEGKVYSTQEMIERLKRKK